MSTNGHSNAPIVGAPPWSAELLKRIDDKLEVFAARLEAAVCNLELAANEYRPSRDRVAELESWRAKVDSDIVELKKFRRSVTPPGGFVAPTNGSSGPPDEAA